MAALPELRLDQLPADPLLHVLSYLSFRDLVQVSYVSRRLHQLSNHRPLWRSLCHAHWLLTNQDQRSSGLSWPLLFQQLYSDLGRYVGVYGALRRAWRRLEASLQQRCPRIGASLKDGATEQELDSVEAQMGCRLPDDYRCSYRIHNGQKLVIPGSAPPCPRPRPRPALTRPCAPRLMGSMALSNHYRSEVLLDAETAAGGFQRRRGLRRCLPLTFCFHTGLSQYLALEPAEGRRRGETFYPCPDQTAQDPSAVDMFITGSSFLDWFTSYVDQVVTGRFPIIRDQIFRYVQEDGCVATTHDISVSVSTSFLPELSSVHPPHFFFTYRIRMEMCSSAPPEAACQLESRYWRITTADGNVEEVAGPGVVGEFPVMTPGRVHEYSSCTTFSTPWEHMEGHYVFHRLANKEEVFQVTIPRFHMACPPHREPLLQTVGTTHPDGQFCDMDDSGGGGVAGLGEAWCPRHI